ncbi:hypothetical protein ACFFRR_004311 [Megaselia abdita]
MMRVFSFLFVIFSIGLFSCEDVTITTKLGQIKGSILKSFQNSDILAFRGIKYATAKRFEEAVPVKSWNNIYDATVDGHICPQPKTKVMDYPPMSEDCLVVNVYTKDVTGNYSVIVHIHGGGNYLGNSHSSEIGPQYILDKDIVLVTMNYRLGPLGFLSTGSRESPGNNGYKDQVFALRWVNEHIKEFGGDPSSITLSGQSAGSMAVTLHMVSPMSKGLFHKAIAMSASTTHHYFVDNKKWTKDLAHYLRCPMYEGVSVVKCLREKTWEEIIDACATWEPYSLINMKWNYEIEEDFGQERFLLDNPTKLFATGNYTHVPFMTGLTKDEFQYHVLHLPYFTGLLDDMNSNFKGYIPEFLTIDPNSPDLHSISDKLYKFYVGSNGRITDQNITQNFGLMYSDAILSHGVHRLVELTRKDMDVYFYRFDYMGQYSLLTGLDGKPFAVVHVDELLYLFNYNSVGPLFNKTDPEVVIMNQMTDYWTSFAKTGKPSSSDSKIVEWSPSGKNVLQTLYINNITTLGEGPYQKRFQFWDELFPVTDGASTKTLSVVAVVFLAILAFLN